MISLQFLNTLTSWCQTGLVERANPFRYFKQSIQHNDEWRWSVVTQCACPSSISI